MIARILQSTLCLCLSPLLVAQQVQQGAAPATSNRRDEATEALSSSRALAAMPDNTKIKLGRTKVATGTPGDSIQFTVVNDVFVAGVDRIPAGTLVNGIVSDTKRGSHRLDRDGQVTVRARDLKSGGAIQVRMAGTSSGKRHHGWPGDQLNHTLEVAALITVALFILALTGSE